MMKTEMKMNDWGLDSLTPKIGDAVKNICKCLDGMTIKDAETVLKMVFQAGGNWRRAEIENIGRLLRLTKAELVALFFPDYEPAET